jgi:hypothetical protein
MKNIITKEESDKEVLTKVVDNIVQGKSGYTHKTGRKPFNYSVKNVYDTLLSTRSISLAAKELNCSRAYIYQVLKEQRMTLKEVLMK